MSLSSRPYRHPQDYDNLAGFLGRARADIHHSHYLHIGDLTWQLYHMLSDERPADLIQIWEDASAQVVGFVLLYPAFGFFDLQLDPHRREHNLEGEMLRWAEQRLAHAESMYTLVNNRDDARLALLMTHGYEPNGEWLYLERRLDQALPHPPVPPGFAVRSVAGDHEATARATVLAAAFGAPPSPERYRQFMHAPGYMQDLDIVAAAPDGRFAAFAMGWADRVSRVAQFEPVGTAPDFRRQGLAQAVLAEGLRRMQQHGADRAIVVVDASETAACQLYESVGFAHQWSLMLFTKTREGLGEAPRGYPALPKTPPFTQEPT
jgi:ribosomal protein S18 acetylase RimI-like enzyme